MKKSFLGIGIVLLFVVLLTISLRATKTKQDIRQKAAVPGGTATIQLSPASGTILTGDPTTIALAATIPQASVDGIQIVADITGVVPADFTYHPSTPSGLSIVPTVEESLTNGKRLKIALVTSSPTTPLVAPSIVPIGTFTFTPNQTGSMSIQFDTTYSKITEHQTTQDILGIPVIYTYTVVNPTPTPTPTPNPNYCPGPNGTRCTYTICPPCTGKLCPKNPCRERIGICRNNVCRPR